MGKNCCTCLAHIDEETAPILTMGNYGTPKYLCDECASLIERITLGKDHVEINDSMKMLMDRMSKSNIDDSVTLRTVTKLLGESSQRAEKIKEGTYDFSLDEAETEGELDDIPDELQETEEDKLLDQKDAEKEEKFDKVMKWMWIGAAIGFGAAIIWKLVENFIIPLF